MSYADSLAIEYKIGVGDLLRVEVYDNQDLNAESRVSGKGSINVPLVGEVKAAGLTVNEIARNIEKILADGFLVNPQVAVSVLEYKSKKVTILGMISQPGLYELTGPSSLLELISKAGGLAPNAGNKATIQKGNDQSKIIVVDLDALLEKGDLEQNVQINDRDSIFIAKAGMCYVTGEVRRPGSYVVERDSTILKMITQAGGFTGIASKKGVRVIRVIDGEKKVVDNIDLDSKVYSDDVIVVPESFF
jgi:polysaccharide export outer membrane protein